MSCLETLRRRFGIEAPADGVPDGVPDGTLTPAAPDLVAALDFAYRPMWYAKRNLLSVYYCSGRLPLSGGPDAFADAALVVAGDIDATARLDEAIQRRVLEDLAALGQESIRVLVAAPVHFDTLASAARRHALAARYEPLDDTARRLLVIEIIGMPSGVTASCLTELTAPFHGLCQTIAVRLPLETTDFSAMRPAGVISVGCDVAASRHPDRVVVQEMVRFGRAAQQAGLETFVHGADSVSLVTAALGAGFTYISGSALALLEPRPRRVMDLQLIDIYRGMTRRYTQPLSPSTVPAR